MRVATAPRDDVLASAITPLFPAVPLGARSFYDASADGRRFLVSTMATAERSAPPSPITVVVKWTTGVKP